MPYLLIRDYIVGYHTPEMTEGEHPIKTCIQTTWLTEGLDVYMESYSGSEYSLKVILPHQFDISEFCDAMYDDYGSEVLFENDETKGPCLIIISERKPVKSPKETSSVNNGLLLVCLFVFFICLCFYSRVYIADTLSRRQEL